MNKETPRDGFLFGDHNGPWTTEHITRAMTRETSKRIGFRMTTQDYRHIAISIDRKFIRGQHAEVDEDEEDEEDEEYPPLRLAPDRREGKPVSRNAPCPCGNGKKYKRCCLDRDV